MIAFGVLLVLVWVVSRVLSKIGLPVGRDFFDILMLPGTVFLIASAANSDLAGRTSRLQSAEMVKLGQASFALYMVHALLLQFAAASLGKGYAAWALATLASVSLSQLTFKFIEEPVEAWLRARIGTPRRLLTAA